MSKQEKNSSFVENTIKKKELESILTFGKYKGKTIQDVLSTNPSYLIWAHDTISWFKLKEEIYDEAVDASYKEKMNYYIENFDWGVDPYDFMD